VELSSITLRVLLLFFPGVVCALVVDALTVHRERTPVQFLTNAFALGIGSYLTLYLLRALVAAAAGLLHAPEPLDVTFFDALLDEHVRIAWGEIALAGCAGVVLASGVAAALNNQVFAGAARRFHVSRKTGALDVWATFLSSDSASVVQVRDLVHDYAYLGTVHAFSDTADRAELLLRDVTVFRSTTGTKLYRMLFVYLSRDARDMVIEAPGFTDSDLGET
jgi:hypothetical protein